MTYHACHALPPPLPQAYYVIKAAQEREELQRQVRSSLRIRQRKEQLVMVIRFLVVI